MVSPDQGIQPLASEFAGDVEMTELLDLFVSELPDMVAAMQQCLDDEEWGTLRRIAHQIKGSAGGYGYPTLGSAAGDLEESIPDGIQSLEGLYQTAEALIRMCHQVQAGYTP